MTRRTVVIRRIETCIGFIVPYRPGPRQETTGPRVEPVGRKKVIAGRGPRRGLCFGDSFLCSRLAFSGCALWPGLSLGGFTLGGLRLGGGLGFLLGHVLTPVGKESRNVAVQKMGLVDGLGCAVDDHQFLLAQKKLVIIN